jgi:PAS domain S-box-containing protein
VELLVIGAAYFVLARAGLLLASIHASATPVWPAAGLALAAILLRGIRVWPAIFAASLTANATNEIAHVGLEGQLLASLGIAIGNTLEAVVSGQLITIWSDGARTFERPGAAAKFALLCLAPGTVISAILGVGSLVLAGSAEFAQFPAIAFTWWLGNVAGALVATPVIVLWTTGRYRPFDFDRFIESTTVQLVAIVVGLIAFSPLIEQTVTRSALSILAILPLLAGALRCGPRDTATAAFILSCFAVWGTLMGSGPFAGATLNDSFLLLITFMIGCAVPSLILSADVAERKRVEARLRRQTQDLHAVFSQAIVGIARIDTAGRFTLCNARFCEIVRRSPDDLLRQHIQAIVDPDDQPQVLELLGQAIGTGKEFITEIRYMLPGHARVWVKHSVSALFDSGGAVRHLVVVAEDISDRRLAEQELRRVHDDLERRVHQRTLELHATNDALNVEIEHRNRVEAALKRDIAQRRVAQRALADSERRFRLLVQGVTDYAIFMLDPDGCVTNWNTGAQRIHQYSEAEIVGQHFGRFYTEEERQRGEPARALHVAAYEGKYRAEGWQVRRDETAFWASFVIEAIRDEMGSLVGYAKITRDITERREAQLALERAQEQLAQSQKMEALGQLTGSIAHDFNNLLMITSGYAQILRRRLSDPKLLKAAEAVHTAARRGESLTRQLLAFSRRQPITPVVVDLKERIESVHEMLVGSLRGNVEFRHDIPDEVWPVEVDIAEFELALVNVAVNARDAMPGGGTLTLSVRNVTLKKSDRIDECEGDFVALALADTGVGIAPDVLPKVFEPFFTTKPLGKGTGLGLAQVYGFSRQSGGTVVATSAVGGGTTLTIYLPRSRATLTRSREALPTQPFAAGQGLVLIVEDSPEVAEVTASLVEQLGYRTTRVENAIEALNRLQGGERIDLVLSDIVMPGSMNGIALAHEINNRYPDIPVLLASGYSDVVQANESRFVILRKPFQLPALEKAMREVLERSVGSDDRVVPFPHGRGAPGQ